MENTASSLLLGALFVGAVVMFLTVVAFLPVIVQLLIGYFFKPDFRKQHPGFWKLWARFRLRLAWSHIAGAMWKERNDDEFITQKFKEQLREYGKHTASKQPSPWSAPSLCTKQ